MADIIYPHNYLPMPLRDGYGFMPVSNLVKSQTVNGRAPRRRAFLSTPTAVAVSWFMTEQEAQLFQGWYRDALTDGVNWFYMDLQTPRGLKDRVKCRFTDIYDGPKLTAGNYWTFTATLELEKQPLIPAGWAEFPNFILGANIIDLAINRDWPKS